jgi:predicted small secreted protein
MRVLVLLLVAVIGLAACNTMAGFGKDMEKAGEKIQEKAKK